ncbi:hypothetical protein L195_g015029 [Trifolium pratense]|uniref:Uncharacterized protein n=1 Tax=Trifolium pratense TaxID=57577 RepID=A0A2K3MMD0_TRIPR|nr:hypothetical protein L195_g015029 [Trifolium pratense]
MSCEEWRKQVEQHNTAKKGAGSTTVENEERDVNGEDELWITEQHDLRAMGFRIWV